MAEFNYPTVYPVEPASFGLMLSGIITLVAYLVLSGKWREVMSMATRADRDGPCSPEGEGATIPVYPICDYEIHFAYTFGNAMSVARPHRTRTQESMAAAV